MKNWSKFHLANLTKYYFVCCRFEFGTAIFIAWGGSLLDILGGAMLAASCPRNKHVPKYPSVAGSRSGAPSSTKEYVWECPPPWVSNILATFLPHQCGVKLNMYRKLWFISITETGLVHAGTSWERLYYRTLSTHSDLHNYIIIAYPAITDIPVTCNL